MSLKPIPSEIRPILLPLPPDKKVYTKPTLVIYGDIRGITLGPSPGALESGGASTYHSHLAPLP